MKKWNYIHPCWHSKNSNRFSKSSGKDMRHACSGRVNRIRRRFSILFSAFKRTSVEFRSFRRANPHYGSNKLSLLSSRNHNFKRSKLERVKRGSFIVQTWCKSIFFHALRYLKIYPRKYSNWFKNIIVSALV